MAKTKRVERTHRGFLSKPDNFAIALEISDHFEEVRAHLQEKYWTAVKRLIENHRSRRQFGNWEVNLADDDSGPGEKWYGIAIVPANPKSGLPYARACLQQGEPGPGFPISLGIIWSEETKRAEEPHLPELHRLRKYLREKHGMTAPKDKWSIARARARYNLHDKDVLTQLTKDETIQQLQARELWQFFRDTRTMVERLNARIAETRITRRRPRTSP